MSLNISTGDDWYKNSEWDPIRGKRRQQSMNAKRRNLKTEPEPSIYEKEINLSEPIINYHKNTLDKISLILWIDRNEGIDKPLFDYIREFMSRPRVRAHILVDWDLYEIVRLSVHPEWPVMVRKKDYTSQDIQEEVPMAYDFVKDHLIPDAKATEIITSQILSFWNWQSSLLGDWVYFVDKEWRTHPDRRV